MPETMPIVIHPHDLVIDFEATCCDLGTVPRNEMEIIEFGATKIDAP